MTMSNDVQPGVVARDLRRYLERRGAEQVSTSKGTHLKYRLPDGRVVPMVPDCAPVSRNLVSRVAKVLGLPRQAFVSELRTKRNRAVEW
jgi:predicted RNA binding protein YcfA (HicA-like mRNA interferase family)